MKKAKNKLSINVKLALIVSAIYMCLATVNSFYEVQNEIKDGILHWLFFPAGYFPYIIFAGVKDPWIMVVLCQLISMLVLWPICWLLIVLVRNDKTAKA